MYKMALPEAVLEGENAKPLEPVWYSGSLGTTIEAVASPE